VSSFLPVAHALVAIQDRAARDVNLILFGLWLGATQGRLLTAGEVAGTADWVQCDPTRGFCLEP